MRKMQEGETPEQLIEEMIADYDDWRGEMLARVRDLIKGADRSFLVGDRAVGDDVLVLEGYRWLTEVLGGIATLAGTALLVLWGFARRSARRRARRTPPGVAPLA